MSPRTSFLLPVRDGAATLGEAVASALAQTDPDHEVVVVDDGSTDGSAAVAEAFGDRRVRVLRRPAAGLVAALNAGLEACRGRWVARLDAADRAHPERLARQIPLLEADPTLGVIDGQVRFFRDGEEVPAGMRRYADWLNHVLAPADFDRLLLVESPIAHPAATYGREVVLGLGGYREGPFPEDYDLWLRLHAAGWRLRKVPETLVEMRDRPARLTRTDPRYGRDGFRRVRQDWLAATVLARPRRVVLWAARKESRPWLRWLLAEGHEVVALVDIDPARIGRRRQGVPVVAPEALPDLDAEIGLVALGMIGGRARGRATLARLRPDWEEGRHWWAVA